MIIKSFYILLVEYALLSEATLYNRNTNTLKYRLQNWAQREKMPYTYVFCYRGWMNMVLMRKRLFVHSHSLYHPFVPCYRGLLKLDGVQPRWLVLVYSCLFSSKMITKSSCCGARLRTESSCPSGICYLQLPFLFHRYFRSWNKVFHTNSFNLKVKSSKQTRSESNF